MQDGMGKVMNRLIGVAAVVACMGVVACGKSPATPAASVTALSLSPATDLIKLKATETFSATATYTTGASEAVSATWTSDNPSVAAVSAAGTVTGMGPGQAIITAAYQGQTVTRTVRVVPDYGGTWAGTWAVTSCQVQGGFRAAWCASVQNAALPATLTLIQTRDVLSGTWVLQESTGTVQGTIATSGVLGLTGSSLQSGVTITIKSWQSISTDNQSMTGTFALTWTIAGQAGSAETGVELRGFTKR